MITLGGIALVLALVRLFVFKIPESPKYLLSKGRDAEAVESVNYIARYNGKPETLTLEMMQDIDRQIYSSAVVSSTGEQVHAIPDQTEKKLSMKDILRENFKDFNMSSYRSLFAGRKMAQHSAVTFLIWLTIGIAYPLYFAFITSYLESKKDYTASSSFNHTYMIYCIVSAVGVLGPISAGFLVETRFGRRWMMAISAVLTGVFLFAYTAVGTEAADIGFQCATAILGNFGKSLFWPFCHLNTNKSCRVRGHVCLYSRVFSWTGTRYWYWYCSYTSQTWWSCGIFYLDIFWVFSRPHLRECGALDCGRLLLCWSSLRNTWTCLPLESGLWYLFERTGIIF